MASFRVLKRRGEAGDILLEISLSRWLELEERVDGLFGRDPDMLLGLLGGARGRRWQLGSSYSGNGAGDSDGQIGQKRRAIDFRCFMDESAAV